MSKKNEGCHSLTDFDNLTERRADQYSKIGDKIMQNRKTCSNLIQKHLPACYYPAYRSHKTVQ